jgi:histidinol dehydrogenase
MLAEYVENAGSVFIGHYSPESAGDYASGTNHTLPTNGYAKAYSGVSLDSFVKKVTFQQLSKQGIQNIGNAVELMAAAEGLDAHKNAVSIRINNV